MASLYAKLSGQSQKQQSYVDHRTGSSFKSQHVASEQVPDFSRVSHFNVAEASLDSTPAAKYD
jgi:hypothetical protein